MALRRYSPFALELGEIPLEDTSSTVSAVLAATWGAWTAALTATVIPRIEATLDANWGAWDAEMAATVSAAPVIEAVLSAPWGGWTASMVTVHTSVAVLAAPWGGWTATLTATVIPRIEASLAATWGGWTAASSAIVHSEAVLAANWGAWVALSSATVTSLSTPTPTLARPPQVVVPFTLGCGQYEVYFKSRGGGTFIGRARDLTALRWGRKLDDVSEASISFSLNGSDTAACCGLAATVNPWEHEMSVIRDGEEVWCGPVTGGEIDTAGATASFQAKDLSAWFDHRWVEVRDTDVEFDEADITAVFDWLLSHGYDKDPFNLDWFVGDPLRIPITRTYVSYSPESERWGGVFPNIGSEIRDLLKSRIDYTTIRRVLIAGNLQTGASATPIPLNDKDWQTPPKIAIIGTAMATEQGVGGGNGGFFGYEDDQMWIERPNDADRAKYGLLQSFESAPELDQEDTYELPNMITQRAKELRAIRSSPFIYLQGGTLNQNATVTFDQLIPGRHFRVNLEQTCRAVRSDYLLIETSTTLSDTGEEVSITLVPPGLNEAGG